MDMGDAGKQEVPHHPARAQGMLWKILWESGYIIRKAYIMKPCIIAI